MAQPNMASTLSWHAQVLWPGPARQTPSLIFMCTSGIWVMPASPAQVSHMGSVLIWLRHVLQPLPTKYPDSVPSVTCDCSGWSMEVPQKPFLICDVLPQWSHNPPIPTPPPETIHRHQVPGCGSDSSWSLSVMALRTTCKPRVCSRNFLPW